MIAACTEAGHLPRSRILHTPSVDFGESYGLSQDGECDFLLLFTTAQC